MKLSHHDELLLQRHLDGELEPTAAAAFQARLAAEPDLAAAAAAARGLRSGFAAARAGAARPSAGFTAGVLAATRRLPSRQQLEQADVAAGAVAFCRRLLLAAAVLAGLGLAWQAGLVGGAEPVTLQAAPGDVQRVIEELDARLQSGAVPPPRFEGDRAK